MRYSDYPLKKIHTIFLVLELQKNGNFILPLPTYFSHFFAIIFVSFSEEKSLGKLLISTYYKL